MPLRPMVNRRIDDYDREHRARQAQAAAALASLAGEATCRGGCGRAVAIGGGWVAEWRYSPALDLLAVWAWCPDCAPAETLAAVAVDEVFSASEAVT